ncbi:SIMPL domain-containing protein [uncultured Duodenibacillus sp.]|uniref:SIMPL domain-containing protein n=1 Tax=uncultured Duodenibacillus sp. TaxID=1980699 RepID=UPI00259A09D1|nr:SIMPL domain-containing protein [uncultured Duodenibacillus sp.]
MDTRSVTASVILAVGIAGGFALLGSNISSGIESFVNRDRIVTVKGLSERQVKADRVIWPVGFRELGDDLQDVYGRIEKRKDQVVAFLKEAGLTDAEIEVASPQVTDAQAEMYANQKSRYRYSMTQTVTVSSDKVDLVRDLLVRQSDLIKAGVTLVGDYSWRTSFQFTGLNTVKPAMIEEATKNARASAEKFAQDSGSSLGKILRANQGQFSITDRDSNTPYIKSVRVVTTVEYFLKD